MIDRYLHTGLLADPTCKLHVTGWDHPESPDRFDAAFDELGRCGVMDHLTQLASRPASDEEILYCHTPDYLAAVKAAVAADAPMLPTGDTEICSRSLEVALLGVGGVMNAVDAVVRGQVKNAFCLVRPPGHHATAQAGMGFCIFNNVALAARHAQQRLDIRRVLIVDWDVHHGNGTQDIFYEDKSVFYFSTHQHPLYPGTGFREDTGRGNGEGFTMNFPLPAGSGRSEVMDAFENGLLPAMDRFQPELILISAGFDSREGDTLGGFRLTDQDFSDLTRLIMELADLYARSRVISVLEGGYQLSGLATAVAAHVRTLSAM